MKRFSILIQLRFIYAYILIYTVAGYFYESYFKRVGVYSFLETYFGMSFFFVLLLAILNFYSFFIKCRRKKMVYNTRKFFLCILVISIIFLWSMNSLDIPLKKEIASNELLERSIEEIFYQKKLGLIFTFLFDIVITKFYFLHIYIALYVLLLVSFFFIGAKSIRRTIGKIIAMERERREIKRNRKALEEQERLIKWIEEKEREAREEQKDDISI